MQTADSPGEDRVLKKIKLKGKEKMKAVKNKLVIAAALILILSSDIFAQGNFTTEWESPSGWGFYRCLKSNLNSNIKDLLFKNLNNSSNLRVYDGATHQLKYEYTNQIFIDNYIRGINDFENESGLYANSFDFNGDGINEIYLETDVQQTLYLKIVNLVDGNVLYDFPLGSYPDIDEYFFQDTDGDSYLELILVNNNGTMKIISTPAHTVSVSSQKEIIKNYELKQNYPNPFNPNTTIEYNLNKSSDVKVIIYDILGKEVSTLVNEKQNPGIYKLNLNGSGLSSGTYFYRLQMDGIAESKKMILLK